MSNHYTALELDLMKVDMLLASDPVFWSTFDTVLEADE